MDLRDLVSGETIHVKEVSATAQAKRWDVLFAWIVELGDHLELTGAAAFVPRHHLEVVLDALKAELERARRTRHGIPDRQVVGEIAWAPIAALRDAYDHLEMPQLRNMHGEELVLCKAHYRCSDVREVRRRLSEIADLEPTEDGFVWLDPKGHPSLGDGPLNLGSIRISHRDMVLEVNSRDRLTRGRALIEAALEGLIVHEADSAQDVESAMREQREEPKRPRDEIPEDIRREILGQHLRQHYDRWIDMPISALGGKSPRKAVKTRSGRAAVAALLKDAENRTVRMEGGEAVDFDALRRKIGLISDDDAHWNGTYDASTAPEPRAWLAADDQAKTQAIQAYHRSLGEGLEPTNPRLHALMHVIVENQLAGGDLPEVWATLERLTTGGVTRHAAVHAIGSVVAQELWRMLKGDRGPFDRGAVARSLARLRPQGEAPEL